MKYDVNVIESWIRQHGIVVNRVGIVNQVLGCRYDNAHDNPCVIRRSGSRFEVRFNDALIVAYERYDLPAVLSAVSVMMDWADCVWHLRRARVSFS